MLWDCTLRVSRRLRCFELFRPPSRSNNGGSCQSELHFPQVSRIYKIGLPDWSHNLRRIRHLNGLSLQVKRVELEPECGAANESSPVSSSCSPNRSARLHWRSNWRGGRYPFGPMFNPTTLSLSCDPSSRTKTDSLSNNSTLRSTKSASATCWTRFAD